MRSSTYATAPPRPMRKESAARARAALPDGPSTTRAVDLFACLAESTRLHVILAIAAVGELCVTDIAHAVGMSIPAVSTHLRLLRGHGLVKRRNDGKNAFYTVNAPLALEIIERALSERAAPG